VVPRLDARLVPFAIQDSVLTALGRAVWVPLENAVFALLKLGLRVVLPP
jgi:hypothetical protein